MTLIGPIALMVAGLIAVPMFVSSTRSAALQLQLAQTCVTDLGISLFPLDADDALSIRERAATVDHLDAPHVSREAFVGVEVLDGDGVGDGVRRTATLIWRPDAVEQLPESDRSAGSVEPESGEVLVPEWATADGLFLPGSTLRMGDRRTGGDVVSLDLVVAGAYPEIPTRPEPDAWCQYADVLRPSAAGDRPPPVLLTGTDTFESFAPRAVYGLEQWSEIWRLSPDADGLRIDEARDLVVELQTWVDEQFDRFEVAPADRAPIALSTSIRRAEQVGEFVSRTIEPLRWATVLVAAALLVSASVLVARRDLSELRLRVLRGVGPLGLAASQLSWLVPVTVAGLIGGSLTGWVGVRLLGPSPEIEPGAIRAGLVAGVLGAAGALCVVTATIAVVGTSSVDRRRAPRRSRLVRLAGETFVAATAVWSFWRLDQVGGVRQIGVQVRGGDTLAQAFPLLGALAAIVVVARPIAWSLRRLRARRLVVPLAVRLGLRRVAFAPAVATAVVAATAFAVSLGFQAATLTRSVEALLDDKAAVQVGADRAIRTLDPASSLDGLGAAATEITVLTADDRVTRIMRIDPDGFADAVLLRRDGLDRDLDVALAALAEHPTQAAFLIDPDGDDRSGRTVGDVLDVTVDGTELRLDIVATGDFFPGYESGRPLVVVDASAIDTRGERKILVRDPVADVEARLFDRGVRVSGSLDRAEVFDSTNFLSLKWSYDTLMAFACLLGVVTIAGQFLLVESRRRQRRRARVLTQPMGLRRRSDLVASLIEIGVPMTAGTALGLGVGWVTARIAIGRLDSLASRQPPALLDVDVAAVVGTVVVVAVAILVLAMVSEARSERGDPMEAMRVVD